MFSDLARSWRLVAAAALLPLVTMAVVALKIVRLPGQQFDGRDNPGASGTLNTLEVTKRTLAKEREQLASLEREQARLRSAVIHLRKLEQDGKASKPEVEDAEKLFIAAVTRVHEMRNAVVEADIAIAEAVYGEKVDRMPPLPVNGYAETSDLARFNGPTKWSIREAPRLERYFSQTFGRRLPITAFGQSATHNRLNFDHRDAIDVALHPDSIEGKALMAQLRKTGVPFIAFRSAVPGSSTGPHIHIGRPSARRSH
jgi:hypothetical protein